MYCVAGHFRGIPSFSWTSWKLKIPVNHRGEPIVLYIYSVHVVTLEAGQLSVMSRQRERGPDQTSQCRRLIAEQSYHPLSDCKGFKL